MKRRLYLLLGMDPYCPLTASLDVSASADDVAEAVGQVIQSASNGDEHTRSVLMSNMLLAGIDTVFNINDI